MPVEGQTFPCPAGMTTVTVTGSRSAWADESGSAGDFSRPEPEGQPGTNEPGPASAPDQPYFAPPIPPSIILAPSTVAVPVLETVIVTAAPLIPAAGIVYGLFEAFQYAFDEAQARLYDYFNPPIPPPSLTAPDFVDLVLPPDPVRRLPDPEPQPMVEIVVRPGTGTPLRDPRDFPFDPLPAIGFPFYDPMPQLSPPIFAPLPRNPVQIAPDLIQLAPPAGGALQLAPPFSWPEVAAPAPAPPPAAPPAAAPRPPAVAPPPLAPPQLAPFDPIFFDPIPPQLQPNLGFYSPPLTASYPGTLTYPFNDPKPKPGRKNKTDQDQCEENLRPPCEVGYYTTSASGRVSFKRWGYRKSGCKPNARNAS